TFVYSPAAGTVLMAGAARNLSVAFTPANTTNYTGAGASVSITVQKRVPAISWPVPASITEGTPLGDAQLNAVADVPGTFVYTPPAGTILSAGTAQILSLVFTPSDSVNYTTATMSAQIAVLNNAPGGTGDLTLWRPGNGLWMWLTSASGSSLTRSGGI